MKVWRVEDGRELATMQLPWNSVFNGCFSPDGARIARIVQGGGNYQVVLWDVVSGKKLQELDLPSAADGWRRWDPPVFDPGGTRLAVKDGAQVLLFDVDPGRPARAAPPLHVFRGHDREVRDVAFGGHGCAARLAGRPGCRQAVGPRPARDPLAHAAGGPARRRVAVYVNADGSRIASASARGATRGTRSASPTAPAGW